MFVVKRFQKNIHLKEKPIVVNNVVLKHYIRSINRKVEQNRRNSAIDYFILFSFYFLIAKDIVCLRINENDHQLRLYLFDLTLFMGGVKHFTMYAMILAWTAASLLFKYFHLSRDKKLMQWVEILEYITGMKELNSFTHPLLTPEQEDVLKYCMKLAVQAGNIIVTFASKL